MTGINVHPVAVHLARAAWTLAARQAFGDASAAGHDGSVQSCVEVIQGGGRYNETDGFEKSSIGESRGDELNNNLSERLQGTFRDRDKTLRGLKQQESGQLYIDGLVLNYNFFRPHIGLKGKRPAESAGAEIPFTSWIEVATMVEEHSDTPQN